MLRSLASGPVLFAAVAGFAFGERVAAHHSVLAFDGSRGIELTGVVTQIHRVNPHTLMLLAVETEDGTTATWTIESESAILLSRLGWDEHAIGVGDSVTVIGAPAKDGGSALRCQRILLEDGRRLACYPGLDGHAGE